MKNGPGHDFRLMTRVLPRPLVLQGGKSFDIKQNTEFDEINKLFKDVYLDKFCVFFNVE